MHIMLATKLYHNLADSTTKFQALLILKSQYYGIVKIDEHKTRKYRMGKNKYLPILEKVASIAMLLINKCDVGIMT